MDETKDVYTAQDLWVAETPNVAGYRYINWTTDNGNVRRLREVNWDTYNLMSSNREGSNPRYWTQDPANFDIYINPLDKLYTMDLFYIVDLDLLTDNLQVPLIPNRNQQTIIYGACMKLATYVGQPTLFDTYSVKYAEALSQLMRESNPAKVVRKRPVA